jgi:hypothetical protein
MNDEKDTSGGEAKEAAPAISAPGREAFWVDGDTAIAAVKRCWPELSPNEIGGALRAAVDSDALRYRRLPPPPPPPPPIVGRLGGGLIDPPPPPPWYDRVRFDEQDVIRFFAERQARLAASMRGVAAAPEREAPGDRAEPHEREARIARGPKPKDFWPKVLGYAAGWLAEKGEAPQRQAELEAVIRQRIMALGGEAEPSTVRPYAREMLEGYRAQLDDE